MESRRFAKLFPTEVPRPRTPVTPGRDGQAQSSHLNSRANRTNAYQRYEGPTHQTLTSTSPFFDEWAKQADLAERWMTIRGSDRDPAEIRLTGDELRTGLRTPTDICRSFPASLTKPINEADKDPVRFQKRSSSRSSSFTSSPRNSKPSPVSIPMQSPRDRDKSMRYANNIGVPSQAKHFFDPSTLKFKCTVSATISDAMRRRGWKQVADDKDDSWNVYWCDMHQMRELYYRLSKPLEENQRIGHFRNSFEVSRKNLMAKNLRRFKSRMEKQFGKAEGEKLNFFPQTFILPEEHSKFLEEFRRDPTVWVIKPAAGAQGRGIFIFSKLKDYQIWRAAFDPIGCQRRRLASEGIQMKSAEKTDGASAKQLGLGHGLRKYIPPIFGPGAVLLAPTQTTGTCTTTTTDTYADFNNNTLIDVEPQIPLDRSIVCLNANNSLTMLTNYVEQSDSETQNPTEKAVDTAGAENVPEINVTSQTPAFAQAQQSPSSIPDAFPEPEPSAGDTDDDNLDTDVDPSTTSTATTSPPPTRHEIFVVQKYILNPYLLGGRKFDLRLYVLVESFTPLKVWVHREGFARFSGGQYNVNTLQDIYVHLTNVAIQKTSENYDSERGSKWPLYELRAFLLMSHEPKSVYDLFSSIDNIIIRTLQSAQHAVYQDRHCFEVYGFDILIDDALKAWLLEVNSSPAFTPSSEQDYRLKCSIIDDVMHVLDVEKRLTGFEKRVGGFDLIWNGCPVYSDERDQNISSKPKLNSFIGCHNDRVNQLFSLFQMSWYVYGVQSLNAATSSSQEFDGEVKPPNPEDHQATIPDFDFRPPAQESTRGEFVPIDISRIEISSTSKEIDPSFKVPDSTYPIGMRGHTRSSVRVADSTRSTARTNATAATVSSFGLSRGHLSIPTAADIEQFVQSHSPHSSWQTSVPRPSSPSSEKPKIFARSSRMNSTTSTGATGQPLHIRHSPAPVPYKTYVNNVFARLSGIGATSASTHNRKFK